MPCFKGLAVSIHTPDGPISEYSIQKQTRASRITTYIPVPPAKVPPDSTTGKPEQSTFAISITLLTPGLSVPYSAPKPTKDDPYPRPRTVGGLPGYGSDGNKSGMIPPYIPRTTSPNETIAAYIYFDGRAKEEVATLLRRGEETWVNSRWVGVPESEGGGLAEREFLFREVGLERWLNGLDLEGSNKDKAARIERRQRRLEKKRLKKKEQQQLDSDDEQMDNSSRFASSRANRNGVLRYGGEDGAPVEDLPADDGLFSSDSDSEDEPPEPEAAGQIKVALYRVLASGEVKRGEYSPQFDAHDDDEGMDGDGSGGGGANGDADIDHTTSFAKPKTLDPKSISTQTVTGLDPPESPYAVFTFFYRGAKQLQKMGILPTPAADPATPASAKRKPSGPDYSKFGPLKTHGTVGYSGYRDPAAEATKRKAKRKDKDADAMDSDADDDDEVGARLPKASIEDGEETDSKGANGETAAGSPLLSPEDARRQGEIAEGVQKIKLKRAHSAEPIGEPAPTRKSPHIKPEDASTGVAGTSAAGTPQSMNSTAAAAGTPPDSSSSAPAATGGATATAEPAEIIGSPFKRHRPSVAGLNGFSGIVGTGAENTGTGAGATKDAGAPTLAGSTFTPGPPLPPPGLKVEDQDEEL